jgi:hypothetical protein
MGAFFKGRFAMPLLSTLDLVALAWFFGAWVIYSLTLTFT